MAGKMKKVMGEFKQGTLHSSSGPKVTSRKQAIAIGLSEARQAGERAPKRRVGKGQEHQDAAADRRMPAANLRGDIAEDKRILKGKTGGGEDKGVGYGGDKKWIQGAIKRPGQLHRDLGVPQGKNIPPGKLSAAAKQGGKVGQRARLAQTLKGLRS